MLPFAPNHHRYSGPNRPPRIQKKYTYIRADASHSTKPSPEVKPPSPPPSLPNAVTRKKSLYLRAKDPFHLRRTKSFFQGKGKAAENEAEHEHATDQQLEIPSTTIRLTASTSDLYKHISDQDKTKETEWATVLDSTTSVWKEQTSLPSNSHDEMSYFDNMTLYDTRIHDGELSYLEGTTLPEIRIVEPEDEDESKTHDDNKKEKGGRMPKFGIFSLPKEDYDVAPRNVSRVRAWFTQSSKTLINQEAKSKILDYVDDKKYTMSGALQDLDKRYNRSAVDDNIHNKPRPQGPQARSKYNIRGCNTIHDAVGRYDEHYIFECRTGRLMRTASFVHPASLNLTEEDDDEELGPNLLDRVHLKVARREAAMKAAVEQRRIEAADRLFAKLMFEKIHEELRPVAQQSFNRRCKEATEKIKKMLEEKRAAKLLADTLSAKGQGLAVVAENVSEKRASSGSSSTLINNRLSSSSVVLTPMAGDAMRERLSSGSATLDTPIKRLSSGSKRTYTPPTISSTGPEVEEMLRNCYASGRAIRRAERAEIRRSSAAMSEEMMRKAMASEDPDSSDLGIYEPSLDMTGYKFSEDKVVDGGVGNIFGEDGIAADRAVTDDTVADEPAATSVAQDGLAVDGMTADGIVEAVDGQRVPRLRSMRVSTGQGKRSRRISGEATENWWINMR